MDERLEEWLQKLQDIADDHRPLMLKCIKADDGNFYPTDFLAGAALNRSLSNIEGFSAAHRASNYALASSIVRLQLDTLLRFFALHLVSDPDALALDILAGKKLHKIKSKDGNFLRDAYLCKKFSEDSKEKWVETVYDRTSGFIHLSRSHIFITLEVGKDDKERLFEFAIGEKGQFVPYECKEESIECMIHITKLIVYYIWGWAKTKERYPPMREATRKSKSV